jgi:hypothetical protein
MATIHQQDYTFVTNNRSDFLVLHGMEPLHAAAIIIFPYKIMEDLRMTNQPGQRANTL